MPITVSSLSRITACKTLRLTPVLLALQQTAAAAETPTVDYYDMSLAELLQVKIDVVSRFNETPVQAAASVSHLDASQWQAFGATRNSDALSILPGVMIYPSTGDAIAIRGYGQVASRRGIATLIDGISVNDISFGSAQVSMEHVSLGVLDSLDLIRGPGSVQYGTDAFHGVVSLNTYYRETADNRLRLSAGSEGEARGSWQFSQPFGDGQFFNVALDAFELRDDHRDHRVYGNNGIYSPSAGINKLERDEDTHLGTALLKWHNRRDAERFYQITLLHNNTDFSAYPGGGATLGFRTADEVGNDSYNTLYKLELEQRLDTAWSVGGYGYYSDLNRDIDYQYTTGIEVDHKEVHKHGAQLYAKYLSADQTLRLFSALEYGYQRVDDSYIRGFFDNGLVKSQSPGLDEGLHRRIDSILLQARKDFSLVELELGVRHDDYSDFGEQTTPRVALIKQFADRQTVKLIYANAFRAAVSAEILGNPVVRGDPGIDPETLDSWELVYSREFDKAFVALTLFKSQWQDGITQVPIVDPVYRREYANTADSNSHGAELSFSYETGRWLLNTDITYSRSEDEYRDIDYTAFPTYIWNLRLSYNLDADTRLHLTQRVREDMTSGHNNFCVPPTCATRVDLNEDLATYWRVDIGVVRKLTPTLSAELVFNNLFDRNNYVPSVYNSPEGIVDDSASVLATLNLSF